MASLASSKFVWRVPHMFSCLPTLSMHIPSRLYSTAYACSRLFPSMCVCQSVCLTWFFFLSICSCACLHVSRSAACQPMCIPILAWLPTCVSACLSVCLLACSSTWKSACVYVCLSLVGLSVHPPARLFSYFSVLSPCVSGFASMCCIYSCLSNFFL